MGNLLRRLLRWLSGRPDKVMYIGGSDAPARIRPGTGGAPTGGPRRGPGRRRRSGSADWSRGSCWPGRR